ncbi:hypothetical protein L1N85_24140 [Paenibacillus alkaliterrae]|uniref:hypothetical protein n=1 Tax=Paenibacillus alkaliterrae TaxID=320909 RepID=UPI001F41998D|nr:hypothetical protein [Paenibacillus alkaliterrae]MCF2941440.1 hypothetical protein [Paenibacillus alkaliterrae]
MLGPWPIYIQKNEDVGASIAAAAPGESQRVPQKKNLVADIGEIPNKLPKTKLELTSKRTKYSTRFLNPD